MNLDLDELIGDWDASAEEVSARVVRGGDGEELLQLRVDLGVLQMRLDGRPDGQRYRGFPTVFQYVQHDASAGFPLGDGYLEALHRELQQFNYRRLALSSLAEDALRGEDPPRARGYLQRALRDIEFCLEVLRYLEGADDEWDDSMAVLAPTLVFNRARLLANLRVAEQRYDEAIEEAQHGARELSGALTDAGLDREPPDDNPAICYLRQLEERLREQHGISLTLRERLDDAIEREDFEAAARLRDELSVRRQEHTQPRLLSPDDA